MRYNGPVRIQVRGARDSIRVPFLATQGRRLLAAIEARVASNPTATSVSDVWEDEHGGVVRVLWTPYVKSCDVYVPEERKYEPVEEEREDEMREPEGKDELVYPTGFFVQDLPSGQDEPVVGGGVNPAALFVRMDGSIAKGHQVQTTNLHTLAKSYTWAEMSYPVAIGVDSYFFLEDAERYSNYKIAARSACFAHNPIGTDKVNPGLRLHFTRAVNNSPDACKWASWQAKADDGTGFFVHTDARFKYYYEGGDRNIHFYLSNSPTPPPNPDPFDVPDGVKVLRVPLDSVKGVGDNTPVGRRMFDVCDISRDGRSVVFQWVLGSTMYWHVPSHSGDITGPPGGAFFEGYASSYEKDTTSYINGAKYGSQQKGSRPAMKLGSLFSVSVDGVMDNRSLNDATLSTALLAENTITDRAQQSSTTVVSELYEFNTSVEILEGYRKQSSRAFVVFDQESDDFYADGTLTYDPPPVPSPFEYERNGGVVRKYQVEPLWTFITDSAPVLKYRWYWRHTVGGKFIEDTGQAEKVTALAEMIATETQHVVPPMNASGVVSLRREYMPRGDGTTQQRRYWVVDIPKVDGYTSNSGGTIEFRFSLSIGDNEFGSVSLDMNHLETFVHSDIELDVKDVGSVDTLPLFSEEQLLVDDTAGVYYSNLIAYRRGLYKYVDFDVGSEDFFGWTPQEGGATIGGTSDWTALGSTQYELGDLSWAPDNRAYLVGTTDHAFSVHSLLRRTFLGEEDTDPGFCSDLLLSIYMNEGAAVDSGGTKVDVFLERLGGCDAFTFVLYVYPHTGGQEKILRSSVYTLGGKIDSGEDPEPFSRQSWFAQEQDWFPVPPGYYAQDRVFGSYNPVTGQAVCDMPLPCAWAGQWKDDRSPSRKQIGEKDATLRDDVYRNYDVGGGASGA